MSKTATATQTGAEITLDHDTTAVARPASDGWTVVLIRKGERPRTLGRSNAVGARRAIHDVVSSGRPTTRQAANRRGPNRNTIRPTRAALLRADRTPAPTSPPTSTADEQAQAWAALRAAVQATDTPKRKRRRRPRRSSTAPIAPTPTFTPANAAATIAAPAPAPSEPAAGPAPRPVPTIVTEIPAGDRLWAALVTLDEQDASSPEPPLGTDGVAAGPIAKALSAALTEALGERAGSRARKALRSHGLLKQATVFEHRHSRGGRSRVIQVHVTPLRDDDVKAVEALDEDARRDALTTLIRTQTRHLPVQHNVALLSD